MSFVAPFMILISAIGLGFRQNTKKIFYIPIGLMGISIILEKGVSRKVERKKVGLRKARKRPQYSKR